MTTNTNTNPWWIVYWSHPQTGRGAVATNGHAYMQAGDAAGADAAYLVHDPNAVIANTLGPYSTLAAAQSAASNPDLSVTGTTTSGAATNFSGLVPGLGGLIKDAGTFFSDLTSANFWLRLGEVVLGLILIAVGVAELTHAVPVATHIAKAVGSTAALAAV
jgi:hypothetical protein